MEKYDIYVACEFVQTEQLLQVSNPYDNGVIAETYIAGKTELDASIEKALSVKKEMRDNEKELSERESRIDMLNGILEGGK